MKNLSPTRSNLQKKIHDLEVNIDRKKKDISQQYLLLGKKLSSTAKVGKMLLGGTLIGYLLFSRRGGKTTKTPTASQFAKLTTRLVNVINLFSTFLSVKDFFVNTTKKDK